MDGIQTAILPRQTGWHGVPLFLERDGPAMPEFVAAPIRVSRPIPGSSSSIIQHVGFLPARVTYTAHVGSLADFAALAAKQGESGTLTLSALATASADSHASIHGEVYANIANVELVEISEPVSFGSGRVRCRLTFERGAS